MTSEETKTAAPAEAAPAEKEAPAAPEKEKEADAATAVAGDKEEKKEAETKKPEPEKEVPKVHKQDFEQDVVYLYQFCRTPFLPSLSPYCLKVETWLRLAGLKYEVSSYLHIYPGAAAGHAPHPARSNLLFLLRMSTTRLSFVQKRDSCPSLR